MSNVILFSRFKLSQPAQSSLVLSEEDNTIAGLDRLAEQLRDQMAIVTKYLENLQLHLEAQSVTACSAP